MIWTTEQLFEVKTMYLDGLSMGKIGNILNEKYGLALTRSAVSGAINRIRNKFGLDYYRIEPRRLSEPRRASEPLRAREPYQRSESSHERAPQHRSEPSHERAPQIRSEPSTESEPCDVSEPRVLNEPLDQSEPYVTKEPQNVSEPTHEREPRSPSEPSYEDEPSPLSETAIVEESTTDEERGISIYELNDHTCKYPLAHFNESPPYRFCGAPTLFGAPWCEDHSMIVWAGDYHD